ncbi:MAG: ATP-binding protein [Pleurocapsa sp. MO_226.B13]|nr:ATP-binding protein [Pleurocapsa sp. MO_226.B13]
MTARQYTILIVDDSFEDREVYRRYLQQESIFSYKIIETESGEEGLEQLALIQPDLILIDYLLPDFTGLEFIEELKAQFDRIPPIIMLTGQGNETVAVEAMKSGVKDYLIKGNLTAEILIAAVKNVLQQHYLQLLLTKSFRQQQLIAETALRIRQSLDLSAILDTAVKEVRLLLDCDRVVIYHFAPDMSGDVVAESIKSGWKPSLGQKVIDTCFQDRGAAKYERGETLAIDNVYKSGLSPCHLKLLAQFQVKANIVVPILPSSSPSTTNSHLWGLLIAHQCSDSRQWETDEVELLDKLAVQLAIAIQQAELIDNLKSELETRKRLETDLARRVEVLEASEDYIGLADVEGNIIWHNPRMKSIFGAVGQDLDPTKLTIADYHPDWAFKIIQARGIPTAIEHGSWLDETALLTKDGREIPVSQLIIAHKSDRGKVKYISTVMRDLTIQKQTEKSLQQRAEELEWVNKELFKTTSLLKKRNQELDRFAYVTSHDLKAPLRAISNLATWLGEDLEDQIPEENQQQLKLMQSRVKRMDGLIQGLLEYSRVGRKSTPTQIVNVKDVVLNAIDSLSPPPEFEIIVADNLPTLKTEVILLEQVFANLISNAIKYHPQKKGKVVISVQERDKFYEFAVCDDGLGIDPRYHDRIFTIFQTLQARDTFESTGIGLSIVKKIVEGQGGKIWVESQLGAGATFYFTWRK